MRQERPLVNKIKELDIPAHVFVKMVIGDFGCGRARLAELLKENRVYSFDHHDILNEKIIACDMKKTSLKNEKLDIAVFCLSLMGENWRDYITEAKRCLCARGMLMIAETTKKSLSGRLSNLRDEIKRQGFEIRKDEQRGDLTFVEARKL
jgi:Hypothetical methyltransferase